VLSYLSFLLGDDLITVETSGQQVLFLYLSRGRVKSACFPYDLTPEQLRGAVSDLRKAGNGIERWIVPGLEFTPLARAFREDNPAAYAIVPELLDSCRGLPVAEQWKRVRATAFANAERARKEREAKAAASSRAGADAPARRRSNTRENTRGAATRKNRAT
jgi:hypothetical protein